MRKCSVIPYEGNESYIFISYSHRDTDLVFPIIEKLEGNGCRIWYDDGIEGGTEWPEVVATHLKECGLCLAFISSNSLASHNCRREINYSIQRKIPFISIFLEDVELSPGMEMQLSTVQALFKNRMAEDDFFRKLLNSHYIKGTVRVPEPMNPPVQTPVQPQAQKPVIPAAPPKQPVKNDNAQPSVQTKPKKKKGKGLKIALIAAGSCAVLIAGGIVTANIIKESSKVSIGTSENSNEIEKQYDTSSTSITISDKKISLTDISTLGTMTKLETISFKNCSFDENALDGLPNYVPQLKSLTLNTCPTVSEYGFLSNFQNIKYLTLTGNATTNEKLATIDFSKLSLLRNFEVSDNENLSDISPLKNASQLVELTLNNNAISDLSALHGQNELQKLFINNNKITSIEPLAGCTKLTQLELTDNKISDIAPLSSCVNISSLNLSGCSIADVTPVGKMKNLTTLDLTNNTPDDIAVLENNFRLRVLSLENCNINSIEPLKNCTQLYKINLRKNSIKDLSVLSKSQKSLKYVYLDENSIEDLSPLKGSAELEVLSFDDNSVTSLDPLSESTKLLRLSGKGNKITSLDGLKQCSKMKLLYLPDNQLEDITSMEYIGSSSKNMNVDLSNNKIKELHFAGNTSYTNLYLHGNALDSKSIIPYDGSHITLDYNSEYKYNQLINSGFFYITIFDCPTDRIIELEKNLAQKSVKFASTEEAGEVVQDFRGNSFKW